MDRFCHLMGDPATRRFRRRSVLLSSIPALSGCLISTHSCRIGTDGFDADGFERAIVGDAPVNTDEGGSCEPYDSTRCLRTHLEVDPEIVDTVVVQTADGETVDTHEVDDGVLHHLELGQIEDGGSIERRVVLRNESGSTVGTGYASLENCG